MGKAVDMIAKILVIIGGLNWGLVGLTSFGAVSYDWDLVALVLGGVPWLAAIVYILVGLSAIWGIFRWFKS